MDVLFRVDADHRVGLGHLQRCLSLAQALKRFSVKSFFLVSGAPEALKRVRDFGFDGFPLGAPSSWSPADQRQTCAMAKERNCRVIIVDSDEEGDQYLSFLTLAGFAVCAIEDINPHPFPCHLVVNGDAHARTLEYRSPLPGTRFLQGPEYAILRSEFWEVPAHPVRPEVQNVLVIFGGADPYCLTPKVLRLLESVPGQFSVSAVLGPFFRNPEEVRRTAAALTRKVRCIEAPDQVRDLFLEADLAVTGAGQTLYELARVGCPAVAFEIAFNQQGQLEHLVQAGSVRRAGGVRQPDALPELRKAFLPILLDRQVRLAMSEAGPCLVDGQGALRVARELLLLSKQPALRTATQVNV